ncbi:MAG: LysR family transcriptional regulator [Oscillospiraceae bacterium]|nr:LysR family transcriptional regulator [Oscillospiraceae bacterium]
MELNQKGINFDGRSLVCFMKVAELENMTKAAQALYISQAQLSRIIRELEDQFDAQFFDRVGRGIKLNACGRVFYTYVEQMFDLTFTMQKKVRDAYLHEHTQITIASNASSYLPDLLAALNAAMPELKFRQITGSAKKCESLLKEGVTDFVITVPTMEDPSIKTVMLRKEWAIVLYPEGHWLATRRHVSLEELRDERFIGQPKGYGARAACDLIFQKFKFDPNYIIEAADNLLVSRIVDNGLGIAIVPSAPFVQDSIFQNRHVEIDEPVYGYVGLSWLKDRVLTPDDEAFIDIVIQHFKALSEQARA